MLDNLNTFELVLVFVLLCYGGLYAFLVSWRVVARTYRRWRTRRFLESCRVEMDATPRPRLVSKTTHVAAAQNLRVRVRLSDSQARFSEQSGYLGTTLTPKDVA